MTASKNITNPVGMGGGQRKGLSRTERQNNGPHRNLHRKSAADHTAARPNSYARCARRQPQPRTRGRRATTPHRTDSPLPLERRTTQDRRFPQLRGEQTGQGLHLQGVRGRPGPLRRAVAEAVVQAREETQGLRASLTSVRQLIESVNDTLKGRLALEQHGGPTFEGVAVRVAPRILAPPRRSGTTTRPDSRSYDP